MVGTLYVTVGLPGAGKTTVARRLEGELNALRLTPDEWMIPLFGEPEAGGKRDVLEGRLVWLAVRAVRSGVDVILDFGCWTRNERSALRALAHSVGAESEIVFVEVDEDEQGQRLADRRLTEGETTFAIAQDHLEAVRRMFEPPDEGELRGTQPGSPPDGYESWTDWTAERWPTSID